MKSLVNENLVKKIIAGVLASVILAAGISTTAFSFSWFSNRNNISDDIKGQTAGAYFARGKGTKDDPYVINRPIHLYNLAWLQDIGYFDKQKTYFIVEKDLDMTGWTLPPIGNENHPFTGELNGLDTEHGTNTKAVVISNLTISNNFSDYSRHPSSITSISGCNAMGFFGTFGEEGKNYATNEAPVAKSLYLNNLTVKSKEQKNLIGMLAGYVNGEITGIGVSNSKISLPENGSLSSYKNYTNNLSDYTTIGYCEDKYKNTAFEKEISLQSSAPETSQGTEGDGGTESGNGGSIDMNAMYNDLLSIWGGNEKQKAKVPSKRTITYNLDGSINEEETKVTEWKEDGEHSYSSSGYSDSYSLYNFEQNNNDEVSSSYSFTYDGDKRYMTLYGRKEIESTISTEVTTITPVKLPYKFIADANGNNYLSMNSSGDIVNQTSKDAATSWFINDQNQIFTRDDNNTQYFLTNSSGTLGTTTSSSATTWTYDSNTNQISDGSLYLNYSDEDGWNLTPSAYYKITDLGSDYWICNNGTTLSMPKNSDSENNATLWFIENGHYATYVNGTKYYLGANTISNGATVSLIANESNALTFSNGYFSIKSSSWWGTTYYMTTNNQNYSLSLTTLGNTKPQPIKQPMYLCLSRQTAIKTKLQTKQRRLPKHQLTGPTPHISLSAEQVEFRMRRIRDTSFQVLTVQPIMTHGEIFVYPYLLKQILMAFLTLGFMARTTL